MGGRGPPSCGHRFFVSIAPCWLVDRCFLQEEVKRLVAQLRFNCAHDAGAAGDHDLIVHLKGFVSREVPGGDDLTAAAQLVHVVGQARVPVQHLGAPQPKPRQLP